MPVDTYFFDGSGGVTQSSTDWITPSTGETDSSVGTRSWSNPSNITAIDSSYADVWGDFSGDTYSHYLIARNYGFDIPDDATITGVEVEFTRRESGGTPGYIAWDNELKLYSGSITGTDKGNTDAWGFQYPDNETKVYGGSADLWGATLTPSVINNANFGVALSVGMTDGDINPEVDSVRMKIHYTTPAISDPDNAWSDDANAFDGSTGTSASTTTDGSASSNYLLGKGTDAPSSGGSITQVRARQYSGQTVTSSQWRDYSTLSEPTGGWIWGKVQKLETRVYAVDNFGLLSNNFQVTTEDNGEVLTTNASSSFTSGDDEAFTHRVELEVTSTTPDIANGYGPAIGGISYGSLAAGQAFTPLGADTDSHTTDTYITDQQTSGHDTDTLIKQSQTTSHDTDTLIISEQTSGHDTDVYVRTERDKAHDTDTLILAEQSDSHSTDTSVKDQFTDSHDTDTLVVSKQTASHTTDTLIIDSNSNTHTTDTYIHKLEENSHDTDTLIVGKQSQGHSTDTLLLAEETSTHDTDVYVRTERDQAHDTDTLVIDKQTSAHTTDTFIHEQLTTTHSGDTLIQETVTDSHTSDTFIHEQGADEHQTDTLIVKSDTDSHTTDTLLLASQTSSHDTDTYITEGRDKAHSTDTLIVDKPTNTHSTDTSIKDEFTAEHSADTLIHAKETASHDTDTLVVEEKEQQHDTDVYVTGGRDRGHSTDTLIIDSLTDSHTSDTLIRTQDTANHDTDSLIIAPQTKSHSTDVLVTETKIRTTKISVNQSSNRLVVTGVKSETSVAASTDKITARATRSTIIQKAAKTSITVRKE